MLFTGWEVPIRRNCALGLSTARGRTQDLKHSFSQYNTDRPRPVNNTFIFFLLRFKSLKKIFLHTTYVCWSSTRSCWWSARLTANQNKKLQHGLVWRRDMSLKNLNLPRPKHSSSAKWPTNGVISTSHVQNPPRQGWTRELKSTHTKPDSQGYPGNAFARVLYKEVAGKTRILVGCSQV